MVAPAAAGPAVSVAFAGPVASVVPCVAVTTPPLLAVNVITAPLTTVFAESLATTVMLAPDDPSEGTLEVSLVTVRLAAALPPPVPAENALPPHPLTNIAIAA